MKLSRPMKKLRKVSNGGTSSAPLPPLTNPLQSNLFSKLFQSFVEIQIKLRNFCNLHYCDYYSGLRDGSSEGKPLKEELCQKGTADIFMTG